MAFIPNTHNKPIINHKNGVKHDNRVENLEWVTASENTKHGFDVLNRKGHNGGTNIPVALYDLNDCHIRDFNSLLEVAKFLDVSIQSVCQHIKRQQKGINSIIKKKYKVKKI